MIGILLCGGTATRLGMGPKAAVELAPGLPLLAYRLRQVIESGHCSRVFCFVSPYTEDAVARITSDFPDVGIIRQENPGGHGEVLAVAREVADGNSVWIANVDNMGAVPRSAGDGCNALELVPALPQDAGGFWHPDGLRRDKRSAWVSTNTWTLTPKALETDLHPGADGERRLDDLVALLGARLWLQFQPRHRLQPIKTAADLVQAQRQFADT
jgi:hypothetical protein